MALPRSANITKIIMVCIRLLEGCKVDQKRPRRGYVPGMLWTVECEKHIDQHDRSPIVFAPKLYKLQEI